MSFDRRHKITAFPRSRSGVTRKFLGQIGMLPLRRLFRSRLLADRSQQRVQLHEGHIGAQHDKPRRARELVFPTSPRSAPERNIGSTERVSF